MADWMRESKNLFQKYVQQEFSKSEAQKKGVSIDTLLLDYCLKVRTHIGWIKWAFVLSFYFFLRASEEEDLDSLYFTAIKSTIQLGGDTDTNACIVGGLVGAVVGLHGIPNHMVERVTQFDCTSGFTRNKRPEFLSVRRHGVQLIHCLSQFVEK